MNYFKDHDFNFFIEAAMDDDDLKTILIRMNQSLTMKVKTKA